MGLAAIAAPWLGRSTLFDPPWLLWLGLGEALPNTLDWRPLLPWAGVVFLGLGAARLPGVLDWLMRPDRWRAASGPSRAICFAGRHSLPIYLLHQPILIGLLAALTAWGPSRRRRTEAPFSPAASAPVSPRAARRMTAKPAAVASPTPSSVRATPTGWRRSRLSAGRSSSGWPTPAWAGEPEAHCRDPGRQLCPHPLESMVQGANIRTSRAIDALTGSPSVDLDFAGGFGRDIYIWKHISRRLVDG